MFASQLLRVLQTLPPDVNHDTSTFGTSGLKEVLKENPKGVLYSVNKNENNNAAPLAPEINDNVGFWTSPENRNENNTAPSAPKINDNAVFWNTPEVECTSVVQDFTNGIPSRRIELLEGRDGNEHNARDDIKFRVSAAPSPIASASIDLFENPADFLINKNAMQCELPELIVCYKEDTQVSDEACSNELLTFDDNILVENDNDMILCDFEFLSPVGTTSSSENGHNEDDTHESGLEERMDPESPVADVLPSVAEKYIDVGFAYKVRSPDLSQTGAANYTGSNHLTDDVLQEKFVTRMPLLPKFNDQNNTDLIVESPIWSDIEVLQQLPIQIPSSDGSIESHELVSASEESIKGVNVGGLAYNSKVGNATITFHFNTTTGEYKTSEDSDCEPPKVDSEPSTPSEEDGEIPENMVVRDVLHSRGDGSFSMAGLVTSLMNYSGNMPSSGSVSPHSDSSTNSTHSFAFPTVQGEWKMSPVRMQMADRRFNRKQRGWMQSFRCCRF